MEKAYFIGVDVGSASVRAGIFDVEGNSICVKSTPIKIRKPKLNFVEQSSDDIWQNLCKVVKEVVYDSKITPKEIKGIAFDATCSLVAIDKDDRPISISLDNDNTWNIIMWMDHRASEETNLINSKENEVLKYVGGKISLEMQIPKLLWLKNHLPNTYKQAKYFFDLADFLQYKACSSTIRSSCTVTCKWTYLSHKKTWDKNFFKQFGLEELLEQNKIGDMIKEPAQRAGFLTEKAAEEMGLTTSTIVAVGMIDAHAGGVGASGHTTENTLVIIGGTSACHMLNTKEPTFVPGVWGPYFSAMTPNLWLNEGGQSSAGSLIDYTIQNHSYYPILKEESENSDTSIYEILNYTIDKLYKEEPNLNTHLHLLGYHHGNRSPRSDASLKGMISGLSLDESLKSLALLYLAAIQSVCYGTKHIIDTCKENGHEIDRITICGGASKNPLWLQELSNITEYVIEIPKEDEAVLLGSAILAATASGTYSSIEEGAKQMSKISKYIKPNEKTFHFHHKKYKVFLEMYNDFIKYRELMR